MIFGLILALLSQTFYSPSCVQGVETVRTETCAVHVPQKQHSQACISINNSCCPEDHLTCSQRANVQGKHPGSGSASGEYYCFLTIYGGSCHFNQGHAGYHSHLRFCSGSQCAGTWIWMDLVWLGLGTKTTHVMDRMT